MSHLNANLKQLFIVSEFVQTDDDIEGVETPSGIINVSAREGKICSRCWQVVGEIDEDELCDRCKKIVKQLEE